MSNVWLDCDPGHDDAFAIILALGSPELNLIGVSTTAGNQSLEKTTANAVRMLRLCGRSDVPVVMGLRKPLFSPEMVCPEIHGESGLDVAEPYARLRERFVALGSEKDALQENGILYLRNVLINNEEKTTIIATGCLTNIAALLITFPEIQCKIEQIVILGGAVESPQGNIGVVSEFNILLDPHAAQLVFKSILRVVLVPLLVSHTVLVTDEIRSQLPESDFGEFCSALFSFFSSTYLSVFNMPDPPLHDPLAVAFVIDPSLFETRFLNVEVETQSNLTLGQTVVDLLGVSKRAPNVHVAVSVNVAGFWLRMCQAIKDIDAKTEWRIGH